MTGMLTRYNYQREGKYAAAAILHNGDIVALSKTDAGMTWAKATDASVKVVCTEKTDLYGVKAYRFTVVKAPAKAIGFVMNECDVNEGDEYEYATYEIESGALANVHYLEVGDEFVTDNCPAEAAVGTEYGVTAGAIA